MLASDALNSACTHTRDEACGIVTDAPHTNGMLATLRGDLSGLPTPFQQVARDSNVKQASKDALQQVLDELSGVALAPAFVTPDDDANSSESGTDGGCSRADVVDRTTWKQDTSSSAQLPSNGVSIPTAPFDIALLGFSDFGVVPPSQQAGKRNGKFGNQQSKQNVSQQKRKLPDTTLPQRKRASPSHSPTSAQPSASTAHGSTPTTSQIHLLDNHSLTSAMSSINRQPGSVARMPVNINPQCQGQACAPAAQNHEGAKYIPQSHSLPAPAQVPRGFTWSANSQPASQVNSMHHRQVVTAGPQPLEMLQEQSQEQLQQQFLAEQMKLRQQQLYQQQQLCQQQLQQQQQQQLRQRQAQQPQQGQELWQAKQQLQQLCNNSDRQGSHPQDQGFWTIEHWAPAVSPTQAEQQELHAQQMQAQQHKLQAQQPRLQAHQLLAQRQQLQAQQLALLSPRPAQPSPFLQSDQVHLNSPPTLQQSGPSLSMPFSLQLSDNGNRLSFIDNRSMNDNQNRVPTDDDLDMDYVLELLDSLQAELHPQSQANTAHLTMPTSGLPGRPMGPSRSRPQAISGVPQQPYTS